MKGVIILYDHLIHSNICEDAYELKSGFTIMDLTLDELRLYAKSLNHENIMAHSKLFIAQGKYVDAVRNNQKRIRVHCTKKKKEEK